MQLRNSNICLYCCLLCLILGQTHAISWRIICFTSGKNIADSQANQRMILNGLYGSSQQINLDWENGRFMHGHTDIFNVTTEDIGPLQNVTMWNDNTGPAPIWVVTNITFMNLDDGSIYVTVTKDIYVNRTRMISLVKAIISPTTEESRLSTEINSLQESLVPFQTGTYSSESYFIETESKTFLDTASTKTTIPTTTVIYQESTITTDATINMVTPTAVITTINSTNATITSSTSTPMCLCSCKKKLSKKEQIEQLKELKKELTIEKKKTSRYIRKKISVPDNRVSAKATGYIGIVLLICPFAAILAADLSRFINFLMAKYKSKA